MPASSAPRGAAGSPARAHRDPGSRLARLNLVLGAVILALAVGPILWQWLTERPAPPSERAPTVSSAPGGTESPAEVGPASRPRPELDVGAPPALAPTPVAQAEGPEIALAREALGLFRAGRVAEACDRYRELARRTPSDDTRRSLAACLARLGRDAYEANQTARAVELYREALGADAGAPGIWAALAVSHVKGGDLGRAEGVVREALSRFPDAPDLLYLQAEVQERQGRTRDAVETLRRLLAVHPGHARGRSLLAGLEREQKVEGGYWSQESRHFLVRYEGAAGIDVGRSVIDALEEAYESIGGELGVFPPERMQVGIYATRVFGDVIGAPPHLIAGAYDGRKIRLNLAASTAYSRSLSRLVRHEYAHAVIHLAANGRAPVWLHEGLAQVLEPRKAPRLLEVSVPREHLTLSGTERLSRTASPEALVAGYSLTHVAVEHLVDRGGMGRMREFLKLLGRGDAVPQAMRGAFGFGPEEVEARLLAAAGRS